MLHIWNSQTNIRRCNENLRRPRCAANHSEIWRRSQVAQILPSSQWLSALSTNFGWLSFTTNGRKFLFSLWQPQIHWYKLFMARWLELNSKFVIISICWVIYSQTLHDTCIKEHQITRKMHEMLWLLMKSGNSMMSVETTRNISSAHTFNLKLKYNVNKIMGRRLSQSNRSKSQSQATYQSWSWCFLLAWSYIVVW